MPDIQKGILSMQFNVVENAIPVSLCRAAEAAWPAADWIYWHRYTGKTSNKFGTLDRSRIPPACLAALDQLSIAVQPYIGNSFIDYDLHGAGLHMMPHDGYLSRHTDAECHPLRPWRRTHSIVMSVNSEWRSEWGGQLWLENHGTVQPQQGKAVIFETQGVPHEVLPVTSPVGTYRKTLALFAWAIDNDCSGLTYANFGMM